MLAIQKAEDDLKNIKQNDVTLMKAVGVPNAHLRMVMSAVCILLNVEPQKKMNQETLKNDLDYWKPTQKLMNTAGFFEKLTCFDSKSITKLQIKKLKPFVEMPTFNREALISCSVVTANFGSWVLAAYKLYHILNLNSV